MTQEGLLSDPQIRAAKALEEAEVYLGLRTARSGGRGVERGFS
jgi:hypothetical protein